MEGKVLTTISLALLLVHFSECQASAKFSTVRKSVNGPEIKHAVTWTRNCATEYATVSDLDIATCNNGTSPCEVELNREIFGTYKMTPYDNYRYLESVLTTNGKIIGSLTYYDTVIANITLDMGFIVIFTGPRSNTQALLNQDMTLSVRGGGDVPSRDLVCRRFQLVVNSSGIFSVSVLLLVILQAFLFFK